jgi:polysaccharide pyruvyl transferase WcaK-like protein
MIADTRVNSTAINGEGARLSFGSAADGSSRNSESASSKMTPDTTPKTVALFGMFGVGNLGNECTLQALLSNLRRFLPNAQVSCICGDPDATASSCSVPAYAIRGMSLPPLDNRVLRLLRRLFLGTFIELGRWVNAIRKLAGTHMLVMTGTGMLSDLGISPFGLHYDILRWSIAAKLCRCKLLFLSVGAGPIRHPVSKFFVKMALRLADYRSYRDIFSKSFVEGLGIATEGDAVYPDLAFSLPASTLPDACDGGGRRKVVGVGLITYDTSRTNNPEKVETIYRDYIAKVAAFVRWLVEHDYTVRFLIGDVVYDGRVREDLGALLERIGLKYEAGQIIDEPARSVEELLSQLAATDIVVASRFHNVLLALLLRKPVVALSFHEKVDSLMKAMGMTEFCQDIENVDGDKLLCQFAALEDNLESIKCGLARQAESNRQKLEEQYEYIVNIVRA